MAADAGAALECEESLEDSCSETVGSSLREMGMDEFDSAWGRMLLEPCQEIVGNMLMTEEKVHSLPDPDYAWTMQCRSFEADREILLAEAFRIEENLGLSPATTALGINIFDRFCSKFRLPQDKKWVALLAIRTSLLIASKMEEEEAPWLHEMEEHCDNGVFPSHYCLRMELVIMEHLEWRASGVTAVSFLDRLLFLLSPPLGDALKILYANCLCAIRHTFVDIKFLQYRPSCIAAAIILSLLAFDDEICRALNWEVSELESKLYLLIGRQESFRKCKQSMLQTLQEQEAVESLNIPSSGQTQSYRTTTVSPVSVLDGPSDRSPSLCKVGKPVIVGVKRPRPQHHVSQTLLQSLTPQASSCMGASSTGATSSFSQTSDSPNSADAQGT